MSSSLNLIVYFLCFTRRFGLNIVAPSQEQTNQATGTELYIKTPPILLNQGRTFNLELKQPLSPAFCLRMPQVKAQTSPETSRLAEEETKKVFAEIINREKTYGKERSKIVLIDFFNDTNAPDKIKDLDFVENLFNGERDVTKLNDDILDTILSKCRFERKDLQGKENKKCIIS